MVYKGLKNFEARLVGHVGAVDDLHLGGAEVLAPAVLGRVKFVLGPGGELHYVTGGEGFAERRGMVTEGQPIVYPEAGADVVIFPWSLVNMAGGFFWGIMARRASFRHYLKAGRNSFFSHAWFLTVFGLFGAVVMSVPGTLIQAALGEQAVFALNPDVAATLARLVAQWETAVREYLQTWVGLTWG